MFPDSEKEIAEKIRKQLFNLEQDIGIRSRKLIEEELEKLFKNISNDNNIALHDLEQKINFTISDVEHRIEEKLRQMEARIINRML